MKIVKGMYGLPQAGILAYKQLVKHLKPYGYEPCKFTQGFWTHTKNGITFNLCVDCFGIKYIDQSNALHIINALKSKYTISTDWEEKINFDMTLDWNYKQQTVTISIPNYV